MANLVNGLGGTAGFGENALPASDDGSLAGIDLHAIFGPAGLNFFGESYRFVSINTNGHLLLSDSATVTYVNDEAFALATAGRATIAAWQGDGDTRTTDPLTPTPGGTSQGTNRVWYDIDSTGGGRLTVTWDDVATTDFGGEEADPFFRNAFQLEVSGQGDGNFRMVFRYERMDWSGAGASRGGFASADGTVWHEFPGAFAYSRHLELHPGNMGAPGYYEFDIRSGTAGDETLDGSATQDVLAGAAGNDTVNGFAGRDQLFGGAGTDVLRGHGGNDTYTITDSGDSVVERAGGGVDLVLASASHTMGAWVENARITGAGAVDIAGNNQDNLIYAGKGDNVISGAGGNDSLSYALMRSGVTVSLGATGGQATGGSGTDTLSGIENLTGTRGWDTLHGNSSDNFIAGGRGGDTISGGAGDDRILGGDGGDRLNGGSGRDIFDYNGFQDSNRGGWLTADTITGFTPGQDRIDVSTIDASWMQGGNNAFTFIGTAPFTLNASGQLRVVFNDAGAVVFGKLDGAVDFQVTLLGVTQLSAADFVL